MLSVGFTSCVLYFSGIIAAYYFFLKDDYAKLKKHQSFDGLKSEELVELITKLQRNKYMTIFEMFGAAFCLFAFMALLIDGFDVKIPVFLVYTFPSLYLISSFVYVFKRRIKKSIEIFKNAKRTA